jgi:tetratricopeptide (TPR) repeat protein
MALLLACGGSNKDGPSLSSEAAEVFESIKDSYRARKFEESATALDAFLKENPEHSIGWILLGNSRREMGLSMSSKEAYKKAIALDPLRFEAFLGLGVLARREAAAAAKSGDEAEVKAQLRGAKGHYERALSIEPYHAETLSSMAMLLLDLSEEEEALRNAEKAWEITKRDATIAANLAVAYHRNDMAEKRNEMRGHAERLGYQGLENLDRMFENQ